MLSELIPEQPVNSAKDDSLPGSRGAAFLAGLPHLIMGLLIAAGKIFTLDISSNGIAYLGGFLGVLVILVLVAAGRRGWPLWSASWYLYGTWVGIAVIGLVIERLDLQESWRYTNAVFVGWMLVCVLAYFYLLLRNRLKGLLAIAFFLPLLGVMMLEFIPDPIEGWLALFLGLLSGVSAGWSVRHAKLVPALRLGIAVNLGAGLLLSYVGEYQVRNLPGIPFHEPSFPSFLSFLLLYTGASLALIAIPFLVRSLLDFGRKQFGS